MAGIQAAKPGGRGPEGRKDNSITARGRRPMRTQSAALHCRDRAGQIRAWCVGRPAAPGSGSSSGSTARPSVRSNPAGRRPCAPALFAACACQPLVACPSASPHHDDGIMTTSGSALPPSPTRASSALPGTAAAKGLGLLWNGWPQAPRMVAALRQRPLRRAPVFCHTKGKATSGGSRGAPCPGGRLLYQR